MAGDLFEDLDLGVLHIPMTSSPDGWEAETLPVPHLSVDLWPAKLPLEVALCETLEEQQEVSARFGLTPQEFSKIALMPQFRRAVAESMVAVRESGYGFKIKCRAIAEDFLGDLDRALHNPEVGLSTKLDIFRITTKLGELEPKVKKDDGMSSAPSINIQINC